MLRVPIAQGSSRSSAAPTRNAITSSYVCFEYAPTGEPTVVSVVNRGVADDANAWVVDGNTLSLRVSRVDKRLRTHASVDAATWRMVRIFTIDSPVAPMIGFEAQCPNAEGCAVKFDDVRFVEDCLLDLRMGS